MKVKQLYLKCFECEVFFEHSGHKKRSFCSNKCKTRNYRKSLENDNIKIVK